MKSIYTDKAPKAVGPYSQAVIANGFVFCSGQIGIIPATGVLEAGIEKQTHRVLKNISAVLRGAGLDMDKVVKTTVYIKNMNDYLKVNEIYALYFEKNKPARATVEVSNLPKGALVEIEAIAVL
ncbi:MAG: hypothetical protein A3D92_04050 [Bacteroidetes bacterium RIFCSPHIGHO2_02_FULL_44_7]|uniref:Reactive intermediate/imine deaminase n=3 Tax=Candidatus Roizmaniibacteriota TaxID=1752723 RepID=A0A1F7JQX2_9BACT|nr:MAG: hypothetical protein A3D92_04050 [Bacteroidetes bacterium RIFCSPHIGHO2_02_FULL_44_7]OGK38333.1 MAG: hypothetical protein A3F03_02075 [Candidatus Roizmanbacteria bacterium RIFCSPHIGHO2_12_FULL_41_11]OGK51155.1 MAG: hypothetical protein A2966_00240 [Candidatus Roizmanbacteria bacterium RIFCSPLOWO2_01_FULL_41_22]OGK58010.1 MAG: hypothetical protein A3H86_00790 [Candidatus Roizmanbacteria bacterium RIFCSPLOWO2_02_FULL_41_9]